MSVKIKLLLQAHTLRLKIVGMVHQTQNQVPPMAISGPPKSTLLKICGGVKEESAEESILSQFAQKLNHENWAFFS